MQCSGWSILATIKLHLSVGGLSPLHITFTRQKLKAKQDKTEAGDQPGILTGLRDLERLCERCMEWTNDEENWLMKTRL